jgi:hypothetical protein
MERKIIQPFSGVKEIKLKMAQRKTTDRSNSTALIEAWK